MDDVRFVYNVNPADAPTISTPSDSWRSVGLYSLDGDAAWKDVVVFL